MRRGGWGRSASGPMRHSSCCPPGANRCADPMPRAAHTPSRTLTTFTVGFLLLDALLLGYSGIALHRVMLVVWAGVFLLAPVLRGLGCPRHPPPLSPPHPAPPQIPPSADST